MYDISQKSQRDLHSKVTYSHNSPSSCIFVVASQSFPSSSSSPAAIIQLFPPKLFVLPLTFLCIFFFLLQSLLRSSFLPHFFLSSDNRSLKSSFFSVSAVPLNGKQSLQQVLVDVYTETSHLHAFFRNINVEESNVGARTFTEVKMSCISFPRDFSYIKQQVSPASDTNSIEGNITSGEQGTTLTAAR